MNIADVMEAKSPAILKTPMRIRSSDYEKVREIERINSSWVDADAANRERLFDNLRMYMDIDGGSWNREDLAELRRLDRHPISIPIAAQKIRTLAGSIQSEKFDFEYQPLNVKESTLTKGIKHWYYADKEQYNYSYTDNRTLIRGLNMLGIDEMGIRYDIRKTGGIGFFPNLPGTVIKDPYWWSDDLKDWKRAIKHAWLTAQEQLDHFEISDPQLEQRAYMDKRGGEQYEPLGDVDFLESVPHTYGSKLLVIEYRWLEPFKTTRLYGKVGSKWIPFPLEIDEAETRKWKNFYGIKNAEDIREYPYEDEVLKFTTICPQGTNALLAREVVHDVQCGFIGFFPFSACREMGVDKGVMDAYKDIQRTLQFRESKKDDILSSVGTGQMAVDKNALEAGQIDELKQNITKADYVMEVDGDPSKVFGKLPIGEVPQSIWQDIMGMIDLFDRVSPVTPSLEGAATKDESGVLFEMRHAVTKLGVLIYYDNWQNYQMWKAEAWYNQARITYKGLHEEIPLSDKPGTMEFNSPVGNGQYLNSVADLPRARVVVTLSKSSPTEQASKRFMYFDMAKMLSANPEAVIEQFRLVMNKMIETTEMTPDERKEFEVLKELQSQNDIIKLLTERESLLSTMFQSKVGQAQAQQMLKQMQQSLQQAMEGGGGGGGGETPEAISEAQPPAGAPPELPAPEGELAPGQEVPVRGGTFQP